MCRHMVKLVRRITVQSAFTYRKFHHHTTPLEYPSELQIRVLWPGHVTSTQCRHPGAELPQPDRLGYCLIHTPSHLWRLESEHYISSTLVFRNGLNNFPYGISRAQLSFINFGSPIRQSMMHSQIMSNEFGFRQHYSQKQWSVVEVRQINGLSRLLLWPLYRPTCGEKPFLD